MPRQLPPDPDVLKVCEIIGLDPSTALAGSLTVADDPDGMRVHWTGICVPTPEQADQIRALVGIPRRTP